MNKTEIETYESSLVNVSVVPHSNTRLIFKSMKMRSIYHIFVVLLVALVFSACSQDEVVSQQVDANLVQIDAKIENIEPKSRAEIGIDGKGRFIDGDVITLYVNGNQCKSILSAGNWQNDLSWDKIEGESASFKAFFPQLKHNKSNFTHAVEINQNIDSNFEKCDLLYADKVQVNRGEKVNLNFRHLMSCLTVVLKTDDFTEEQLSNAIVKVRAYNKVEVKADGILGEIHDFDYQPDKSSMVEITFKYKGDGTFQAVMCPQDKLHYWSYDAWWLSISINGKTHLVKDPPQFLNNGTKFNAYESGKNVTLTYHVRHKDFANKTLWVPGVDIPDSAADKWEVWNRDLKTGFEVKHLPWNKEYGWFDCSKKNTESHQYNDMNKCWAATASNLIHWWLYNNDKYIQLYCEKKKVKSLSDLNVPHIYTNHHETEVFQAFRDKFTDEGSFARDGLAWYFLGKYINTTGRSELIKSDANKGGYFKEVLGENSQMSEKIAITNMKDLNGALKKAFLKKKGIGFSVLLPGFGASGHAMTIWGAKFDENGDVCAIFFVDNNDGTLNQPLGGLIEARVSEYEGDKTYLRGKACMENSYGKTAIEIKDIDLVDLREDAWKQYLGLK